MVLTIASIARVYVISTWRSIFEDTSQGTLFVFDSQCHMCDIGGGSARRKHVTSSNATTITITTITTITATTIITASTTSTTTITTMATVAMMTRR